MPDRRSVVQAVPTQLGGTSYRITTVHPRTYNEARTIGEHFRDGTPVIMNLTEMHDTDAKRLVDFAAGLVFGLHGSIERVTNKVFLLSPTMSTSLPRTSGVSPKAGSSTRASWLGAARDVA